jgi:flavin-dependent dehydrogenase
MLSAFLSPIGESPIDPVEADEELDADQVHKEWKEYYEHWKKEMEREHKVAVRHLEKSREEIKKMMDRLASESHDLVANALREASNPERFDEQMDNMIVDIGKNVQCTVGTNL